jgi:hypothetical protein
MKYPKEHAHDGPPFLELIDITDNGRANAKTRATSESLDDPPDQERGNGPGGGDAQGRNTQNQERDEVYRPSTIYEEVRK